MDGFVIDHVCIFFLSLERSMKRLEYASSAMRDRGEAGETVFPNKGVQPGLASWGQVAAVDGRCSSTSHIIKIFPRSLRNNKPAVLISPRTTASCPLRVPALSQTKSNVRKSAFPLGRTAGGESWIFWTLPWSSPRAEQELL